MSRLATWLLGGLLGGLPLVAEFKVYVVWGTLLGADARMQLIPLGSHASRSPQLIFSDTAPPRPRFCTGNLLHAARRARESAAEEQSVCELVKKNTLHKLVTHTHTITVQCICAIACE